MLALLNLRLVFAVGSHPSHPILSQCLHNRLLELGYYIVRKPLLGSLPGFATVRFSWRCCCPLRMGSHQYRVWPLNSFPRSILLYLQLLRSTILGGPGFCCSSSSHVPSIFLGTVPWGIDVRHALASDKSYKSC